MVAVKYKKIIVPTSLHADTIVGIFLLKNFGKEKYPEIDKAGVEIWNTLPNGESSENLFQNGYFILDIGGGKFDHHSQNKVLSQVIAEDLGIKNNPVLSKLLTYAERDDKYGKGTVSSDSIDRAFGLSGLIVNVNKSFPNNPQKVIEIILPLIKAHYKEEYRRLIELPEEFKQLQKGERIEVFEMKQKKKKIKVVIVRSDSLSLPGWLRSSLGLKADVVTQILSTGYINILTRPLKRVDLRILAALLRMEEIKRKEDSLKLNFYELIKRGRISEVPEWYFDFSTNSILNGGISSEENPPTKISHKEIKAILERGLPQTLGEFIESHKK